MRLKAKLLAYLQLLRLPNVFTAIADVAAGFIYASGLGADLFALALLIGTSACLYLAGMVLNDFFDQDIDAVERPFRPIPSGRISPATAGRLGFGLLLAGLGLGVTTSAWTDNPWPGSIGLVLAAAVLFYDAVLKRTLLGPLGMGACRFCNLLLAMSLASRWDQRHLQVAAAIGTYIVGISLFARHETRISSRRSLLAATGVVMLGVGLLAWQLSELPLQGAGPTAHNQASPARAAVMVVLSGAVLCRRCLVAVAMPVPMHVQSAVGVGILSLIVLDAIIAFAAGGFYAGLAVVSLVLPSLLLARWVYRT